MAKGGLGQVINLTTGSDSGIRELGPSPEVALGWLPGLPHPLSPFLISSRLCSTLGLKQGVQRSEGPLHSMRGWGVSPRDCRFGDPLPRILRTKQAPGSQKNFLADLADRSTDPGLHQPLLRGLQFSRCKVVGVAGGHGWWPQGRVEVGGGKAREPRVSRRLGIRGRAGPRGRAPPPPREARAGPGRCPQLVKNPAVSESSSFPTSERQTSPLLLYYNAEPDGLLGVAPPRPPRPPSFFQGQTPALMPPGGWGRGKQARFRGRRAVWEPPGSADPQPPRGEGHRWARTELPRGCSRLWRARGPSWAGGLLAALTG